MDPRRPRLSDRSVAVREPTKPPTRPPSRTTRVPAAATAPRPPRYRPLCVSLPLADVQDRDPLAALQHVPQGPRVDVSLRHYLAPRSSSLQVSRAPASRRSPCHSLRGLPAASGYPYSRVHAIPSTAPAGTIKYMGTL